MKSLILQTFEEHDYPELSFANPVECPELLTINGYMEKSMKMNTKTGELLIRWKFHIESPDKGYRRIRDDLERYYGKRFTVRETPVKITGNYIDYYNNRRLQRGPGVLTPMEKHEIYLQAAYQPHTDRFRKTTKRALTEKRAVYRFRTEPACRKTALFPLLQMKSVK